MPQKTHTECTNNPNSKRKNSHFLIRNNGFRWVRGKVTGTTQGPGHLPTGEQGIMSQLGLEEKAVEDT